MPGSRRRPGRTAFTVDDVAGGIVDKLVHRHPHVFAGLEVADADEVDANWERLKAAEKGRTSVLEGIPAAMPALALADKVLGRAARLGVRPQEGDDLGERLLALVVEARAMGRTRSRSCAGRSAGSATTCVPPRPPPSSARAGPQTTASVCRTSWRTVRRPSSSRVRSSTAAARSNSVSRSGSGTKPQKAR